MEFDRLESHGRADEVDRGDRDAGRGVHPAILRATRRAWRRVGLAALVVVGPLALWIAVTTNQGHVPEARPLERVEVEGTAVDLHWTGEGCEHVDGARTQVTEARDEVLVVLWVDTIPDDCTGDEVDRVHRVTLLESLGDRDLIDGACLKPENHGHPRCEVEGADGDRVPCRVCVLDPDESGADASATPRSSSTRATSTDVARRVPPARRTGVADSVADAGDATAADVAAAGGRADGDGGGQRAGDGEQHCPGTRPDVPGVDE